MTHPVEFPVRPPALRDFDAQCMAVALELAGRGRGCVSPNPLVGAVIAFPPGSPEGGASGALVGRGWHEAFGGPHAEINALTKAGDKARGATLYCTLEPCNHTGKTPPCSLAIVKAGIRSVVLGARDPNPQAVGGVQTLRSAGIEVFEGVKEAVCRNINAPFFKYVATGLPLVALKWAMTLDGKTATASGESKWITGRDARAAVHRLREKHDAVLAGIGTILADDPQLNVRVGPEVVAQPRRVILDSNARTPPDAQLWTTPGAGAVLIVCASDAPPAQLDAMRERGAEVLMCSRERSGRLCIPELLRELPKHGILSVFVEGGPTVLGAMLDAGVADRVHAFIAPKLMGGEKSLSAVGGAGAETMSAVRALTKVKVERYGADVLLEGALSPWGESS